MYTLVQLPALTDRHQQLIAHTYSALITPCWISNPPLLRLIVFKSILHSLSHGLCGSEILPIFMLGLILCTDFQEIEHGNEFSMLCTKLYETRFSISGSVRAVAEAEDATEELRASSRVDCSTHRCQRSLQAEHATCGSHASVAAPAGEQSCCSSMLRFSAA